MAQQPKQSHYITQSFLNKLQPPAKGYRIYFSEEVPGFGVRITAADRRTFVVQGRVHGREVRYTIGRCNTWSINNAEKRAKAILVGMDQGVDPHEAERAATVATTTLRELANEYMARPGADMKQSSKDAINGHVKTTFKEMAHKPISHITEAWVQQRFRAVLKGGVNGDVEGGAPGQANQMHAVLKALMNYAIRRKLGITVNPCNVVTKDDKPKLKARTSYIKPNRIGHVWNWLTEQRAEAFTQGARGRFDIARFLLWTGCRLGEALPLQWENVNLDESSWHLPDPKNRNPITLPLSTQAVAMLTERREDVGKACPWVFPSYRSDAGHMSDPRDVLWKPISELAGEAISAHDLRRSFTNYALRELDLDYYRVELLTGHRPTSVTLKHYTDTSDLTRWAGEVQKVADYLDKQALIARSGNVVQLPRKAG